MLRICGAGLVLAAAVAVAANVRGALCARERELASWLLVVRLLAREMVWGAKPLPLVCESLAGQAGGVAGEFCGGLAERLRGGGTLAEHWQVLLEDRAADWHLLAGDVAILQELGDGLGQSDLTGQKKLLAGVEQRLAAQCEESAARLGRLGRLVSGLGWCGGLLLVCLCL